MASTSSTSNPRIRLGESWTGSIPAHEARLPVQPDREERRRYPRRSLNKPVICYVEGARIDACTQNLSRGGVFLRLGSEASAAPGALVGMMISTPGQGRSSVFLFGRVIRVQALPFAGIALRWEKAVTAGTPQELHDFVKRVFGLLDSEITVEIVGKAGQQKSVFQLGRPGERDPEPPSQTKAPVHVTAETHVVRSANPGVLSDMVDRKHRRVPVSIDAVGAAEGREFPLQITMLGTRSMAIDSPFRPTEARTPIIVSFKIVSRKGNAAVHCTCRVESQGKGTIDGIPGLGLSILRVDDGDNPGILDRYVKWLQFKALSET